MVIGKELKKRKEIVSDLSVNLLKQVFIKKIFLGFVFEREKLPFYDIPDL